MGGEATSSRRSFFAPKPENWLFRCFGGSSEAILRFPSETTFARSFTRFPENEILKITKTKFVSVKPGEKVLSLLV